MRFKTPHRNNVYNLIQICSSRISRTIVRRKIYHYLSTFHSVRQKLYKKSTNEIKLERRMQLCLYKLKNIFKQLKINPNQNDL